MKNRVISIGIILFFPFLLVAQSESDFAIRILQDKRVEHSPELFSYLHSTKERERELALLALANIQDTTAHKEVVFLLHDPSPKVRLMAAFALGMFGKHDGISDLFAQFAIEKDQAVLNELAQSIGFCGINDDLLSLIAMSDSLNPGQQSAIPLACARFANRKIKNESVIRFLVSMIDEDKSVYWSTYALMRMNDSAIAKNYKHSLLKNLKSPSSEIIMWTVSLFGNSTDEDVKRELIKLCGKKYDWKIRVSVIRALRNTQSDDVIDRLRALIDDRNEHVSLTALTALDGLFSNDQFERVRGTFAAILSNSSKYSFRQRGESALIIGKRGGNRALTLLYPLMDIDATLTPYIIRAIGETKSSEGISSVAGFLESGNSKNIIAALEAYQNIVRTAEVNEQEKFLDKIIPLFRRQDAGISYQIAITFQDTLFSLELRKKYLDDLIAAFNEMNSGNDVEPMVEILNVFAEMKDSTALVSIEKGLVDGDQVLRQNAERVYQIITGKPSPIQFIANPNAYNPFYKQGDIVLLNKYSGADVFTSAGTIRIVFCADAAPMTTLNFILLAQKKFFNGLTFHRVVSNFVIQGGDPLGNGSGGPGYSIRTEVSPYTRYSTGAVGVASAGKDTEGSQWFVTHCSTPHLDGRYSIFGYTRDLNVVDKIMVGDIIKEVRLIRK